MMARPSGSNALADPSLASFLQAERDLAAEETRLGGALHRCAGHSGRNLSIAARGAKGSRMEWNPGAPAVQASPQNNNGPDTSAPPCRSLAG